MPPATAHILGPDGRPARTVPLATEDPAYAGGWRLLSGGTPQPAGLNYTHSSIGNIHRRTEQEKARLAYWLNPLLYAAIHTITSYVLGDQFDIGDITDRRQQEATTEFFTLNDFPQLTQRMFTEHMLDGETATIWGTTNGNQDQPAMIGLADVHQGLDVETTMGKVTTLKVATSTGTEPRTYQEGEFVWITTDALYNDARGMPPIMRAVPACLAYVALLNHRVRAWEIQGRINAIYTTLIRSKDPHQALAELQARAAAYQNIPRSGAVATIGKDPDTGQAETLEFITPGQGATNAHDDARMLRLTAAAALGLPEHYLGEGGNVTRTTADSMGDPARRAFARRQALVRRWADAVMRTELLRRHGPSQTYIRKRVELRDDGLTRTVRRERVTADQLTWPWVFPTLASDNLQDVVEKVRTAAELKLASWHTLSSELGYDAIEERERIEMQPETPSATAAPATNEGGETEDTE